DDQRVAAEAFEQLRGDGRGRAVGAIDREADALQPAGSRENGAKVVEIRIDGVRSVDGGRLPALRAPRRVGDDRLDFALDAFGELFPSAGEHLDAVVFERVV